MQDPPKFVLCVIILHYGVLLYYITCITLYDIVFYYVLFFIFFILRRITVYYMILHVLLHSIILYAVFKSSHNSFRGLSERSRGTVQGLGGLKPRQGLVCGCPG